MLSSCRYREWVSYLTGFYSPLARLWAYDVTSPAGIRCISVCVVTSPAGIRCMSACVSFLIARWPTSSWNSLQASVCVFSDRTMVYAAAAVIHCMLKHSLQASVCVFSDRTMAIQHLEFVAGQRVCLFWPHDGVSAAVIHCTRSHCRIRDSVHAEEFVAGQRVCLFWPHDGVSAAVIHCTRSRCRIRNSGRRIRCRRIHCIGSRCRIRNSLHAEEFVAGQRVSLFWPHDGTSALGIRCGPACVFFLTARWRISSRNSLHAIALQHP